MKVLSALYDVGEKVEEYPTGTNLALVLEGLKHLVEARRCFSRAAADIKKPVENEPSAVSTSAD
jgi:hypothetical protein